MAKTIRQTALDLLESHGWTQDSRGAWTNPRLTSLKVYIGRGYSIRRGPNKASSTPIVIGFLEKWMKELSLNPIPDRKAPPPTNPVTELRRDLHARIQDLDERQLRTMIEIINAHMMTPTLKDFTVDQDKERIAFNRQRYLEMDKRIKERQEEVEARRITIEEE